MKPSDPLIPPFRFAIVEEGLFRGSYPTEKNFRFLRRLKLKTIVSLTPKPPTKDFTTFCERYNTISKHFTVSKFKDDVTVSSSQVVQLLEMMIDPNYLPLYIHCLDGANVTGTIFMCLRKLQNWSLSSIISEFSRFTRGSTISSSESEFVETFKAEIDVPPSIPNWLWQGVRMTKHPTLKLRLVGSTNQQQQQHHHQQYISSTTPLLPSNSTINTPSLLSSSTSIQQQPNSFTSLNQINNNNGSNQISNSITATIQNSTTIPVSNTNEIKSHFDSGKFMIPNESRSIEALSLERSLNTNTNISSPSSSSSSPSPSSSSTTILKNINNNLSLSSSSINPFPPSSNSSNNEKTTTKSRTPLSMSNEKPNSLKPLTQSKSIQYLDLSFCFIDDDSIGTMKTGGGSGNGQDDGGSDESYTNDLVQIPSLTSFSIRYNRLTPLFLKALTENKSMVKRLTMVDLRDSAFITPESALCLYPEMTEDTCLLYISNSNNNRRSKLVAHSDQSTHLVKLRELYDSINKELSISKTQTRLNESSLRIAILEKQKHSPLILLGEDEKFQARIVKNVLERRNFDVRIASNGKTAFEMFCEIPFFALVIMDVFMPIVNGLRCIRMIRQFEKSNNRKRIPIIICSGNESAAINCNNNDTGGDAFIPKPFRPNLVDLILKMTLNNNLIK
eukprot:gene6599-8168_t